MADWIEMPEREFGRQVERVEKDELFRKLYFGAPGLPSAIRRRRWPGGRLSSSFYEVDESRAASGERVEIADRPDARKDVIALIQKMGRRNFEKYFLRAEEAAPLPEIAKRIGLSDAEILKVHDLLLEIGAEAKFFGAPRASEAAPGKTCIAQLTRQDEKIAFEFIAPYWARGLYEVHRDALESWKSSGALGGEERRRLRHLLKRLETLNLRQSTVFRILESLATIQADFLRTRRDQDMRPVSLRLLARRLNLSPSTVSRALSHRTVRLPWGAEVPMIALVPGQRRVLKQILRRWITQSPQATDAELARRFKVERGIFISRRTVNAVRHVLAAEAQESIRASGSRAEGFRALQDDASGTSARRTSRPSSAEKATCRASGEHSISPSHWNGPTARAPTTTKSPVGRRSL
jgi:AraC-like DNA-binding protein